MNEGTTTSSPGPTPMARSASVIASVPLPTPIACGAPMYAASSASKASTSGPRMKRLPSITSASLAWISSRSGATGVRVSNSGTGIGGR